MLPLANDHIARFFGSGTDIRAMVDGQEIGTIQSLAYSMTREPAPIYTLGNANPRSFSRGRRGIAGTLTFARIDQEAMNRLTEQLECVITYYDENVGEIVERTLHGVEILSEQISLDPSQTSMTFVSREMTLGPSVPKHNEAALKFLHKELTMPVGIET